MSEADFKQKKPLYRELYFQVLTAIFLGATVGHLFPEFGASLKPLGDGFIKLVKMIIAPVIFLTVATGIAGMRDMNKVGSVAGKAFVYFLFFSTLALVIGLAVGKEVLPEGVRVLDRAAALFGFTFDWVEFPWSCEYYSKTGAMMPADGLDQLSRHDAIFLGAVGFPGVPDHISLWGLLLPIRRKFNQYVNLRPIRLMPGMDSPLSNARPGEIDFLIVRENTEGEYSDQGEILNYDTDRETVIQHSVFTRNGVDRIFRYGFETAMTRKRKLTYATKSNGIFIAMPYWDSRAAEMAGRFPEVEIEQYHIDILSAHFVRRPESFDVVVASNLMGDILSDLGAACTGTIGVAPSANLNPEGEFPSMFEPVHGSAPDIFGKNIANPIGQIWSGAMMLEHLGQTEAAQAIMDAIEEVMLEGPRTPDMGGCASTQQVGEAIAAAIRHDRKKVKALGRLSAGDGL